MSACRVVGMGCYGNLETIYRILAKLLPDGVGLADGVLKKESREHVSREIVSLFSGEPCLSGFPDKLKPGKLNIAGFVMRKDENLTIYLGPKPMAAQKFICAYLKNATK